MTPQTSNCLLPDSKEHDHAEDKRENAHQVHAPNDFGVHERLAREASVPFLLVVVVEWRTKEDTFACAGCSLGDFEPGDLHEYGACFGNDDDANDGEEKPCLYQDEHDADGGAKAHGTCVAHVDFGWRAVEPQISEQRACYGSRNREKFVAAGEVRHAEVLAKDKVSANVGHKPHEEHAGENRHGNEAVETVREVRSVGGCGDDERHECNENPVGEVNLEYVDGAERNGQVPFEFGNELVAENGNNKAEQEVEDKSKCARNAIGLVHVFGGLELALVHEALGTDFRHVVGGSYGTEQRQNYECRYGVAVHLAHEQRNNLYHDNEEESAHDGRRFCLSVLVEIASGVQSLQKADVLRHEEEHQDDGEHGGRACAEQTSVEKVDVSCLIKPVAEHD